MSLLASVSVAPTVIGRSTVVGQPWSRRLGKAGQSAPPISAARAAYLGGGRVVFDRGTVEVVSLDEGRAPLGSAQLRARGDPVRPEDGGAPRRRLVALSGDSLFRFSVTSLNMVALRHGFVRASQVAR